MKKRSENCLTLPMWIRLEEVVNALSGQYLHSGSTGGQLSVTKKGLIHRRGCEAPHIFVSFTNTDWNLILSNIGLCDGDLGICRSLRVIAGFSKFSHWCLTF
jgi:hypothetical protein